MTLYDWLKLFGVAWVICGVIGFFKMDGDYSSPTWLMFIVSIVFGPLMLIL